MNELTQVIIYTDGACLGNPGPGGYAAVLLSGERRKVISGGRRLTTNNRMEIMAAIEAVAHLKWPCQVTIYSDSRYLVDAMRKGWAVRWRSNGWKRNWKDAAVNSDLWGQLLDLCEKHEVDFVWVRGHAGDTLNELCDRLSVEAARQPDLCVDDKYEEFVARNKALSS
jgi:ribonuclease HI